MDSLRIPAARARRALAVTLLAGIAGTSLAETRSWDYKSHLKDRTSGQYSKDHFVTSTITLDEKDGKASFRMIMIGKGDPCISRSDLPAEVVRDADTTTITVTPPLAGCEPFRYLIRNDGSGGVRQNRRNDQWVSDGFDHGLTPAN